MIPKLVMCEPEGRSSYFRPIRSDACDVPGSLWQVNLWGVKRGSQGAGAMRNRHGAQDNGGAAAVGKHALKVYACASVDLTCET